MPKKIPFAVSASAKSRLINSPIRKEKECYDLAFHLGNGRRNDVEIGVHISLCGYAAGSLNKENFHVIAGINISISDNVMALLRNRELITEIRKLSDGSTTNVFWVK